MENEIINDIILDLKRDLRDRRFLNYSLLGGDFGKVLCLYYAARKGYVEYTFVNDRLDILLDSIGHFPLTISYCNGIAGLGLGLDLLESDGFLEGASSSLSQFDDYLKDSLDKTLSSDLDFLHGALGIGFYLLLRQKKSVDVYTSLEKIVLFLNNTAVKDDKGGVYWLFRDLNGVLHPNLSLSHGLCSIIMFLSMVYKTIVSIEIRSICESLLSQVAVYFTSKLLNPFENGSYTPNHLNHVKTRLGWCYGDIGTCIALRSLGEVLNLDRYSRLTYEISLFSAKYRIDPESEYILDAGLCHGSGSVALYYANCEKWYKDSTFTDSYTYWKNVTLSMYAKDDVSRGFGSYSLEQKKRVRNTNLLEGEAGIGLLLMEEFSLLNKLFLYDF